MANQQLVDWIKQQGVQGHAPQQIYSFLVQQGYDANSVNESMGIALQRNQPAISPAVPSTPRYSIPALPTPASKPFVKNLWMIALGIVLLGLCAAGIVYMVTKDTPLDAPQLNEAAPLDADVAEATDSLNTGIDFGGGGGKKTDGAPDQDTATLNQITQPNELVTQPESQVIPLDADSSVTGCSSYPDMLDACTAYACEFNHPLTGEVMTREILGLIDGTCHYVEQMPNNGRMECNYTETTRMAVAQFFREFSAADTVNAEVKGDLGGAETSTTTDGEKVANPLEQAMSEGQCVILGY